MLRLDFLPPPIPLPLYSHTASPRHTGGGARSLRVAAAAETAPDHNFGGTSSARGSDTSDLFDLNKPLVPASIPEHLQPPEELAVDLQDQEGM